MLTRSEEEKELVRDRRVSRLERRWLRRTIISVYVVCHLTALTIWLLPPVSGLKHGLQDLVRPYMTFTGLDQNWQMFSPNPDGTDAYMAANITMADGKSAYFEFPRMEKLDYVTKYREERYRKFIENARSTSFDWPPMCAWLANRYKSQHPVSIQLLKFSRLVPPPGKPFTNFSRTILYTYKVASGAGK